MFLLFSSVKFPVARAWLEGRLAFGLVAVACCDAMVWAELGGVRDRGTVHAPQTCFKQELHFQDRRIQRWRLINGKEA